VTVTTYPRALIYGGLCGLSIWLGVAAGDTATLADAVPYGFGAGAVIALAMCAFVAYRQEDVRGNKELFA
jgi:hypothetical protein